MTGTIPFCIELAWSAVSETNVTSAAIVRAVIQELAQLLSCKIPGNVLLQRDMRSLRERCCSAARPCKTATRRATSDDAEPSNSFDHHRGIGCPAQPAACGECWIGGLYSAGAWPSCTRQHRDDEAAAGIDGAVEPGRAGPANRARHLQCAERRLVTGLLHRDPAGAAGVALSPSRPARCSRAPRLCRRLSLARSSR